MDDDLDLAAFRAAWDRDRDGSSGRRYAEALVAAGRDEEALAVCEAMWEAGFPAGRTDAAWIEHDRGRPERAIALMASAIDDLDDEDRPLALGILGSWRWRGGDAFGAEPLLAAGLDAYPEARVDLAHLLLTTGRRGEAARLLEEGVAAGLVPCMLPLANLLDQDGDPEAAAELYRRAHAAGDGHAAWNLALVLARLGRLDEADGWRWRAAQGGDEVAIASLTADAEQA